METFDVIVLAGGRIDGEYAIAAGTTIKALAPVGNAPVLHSVLLGLQNHPRISKIAVVGPPEIEKEFNSPVEFVPECGSAPQNIMAALDQRGAVASRVLVCASDTPMVTAAGFGSLLDNVPPDAEIAMPIVNAEDYAATYPGSPATYVRLKTGAVTIGSQVIVNREAVIRNIDIFESLFARRKSQFQMAQMLGLGFVIKLITGNLTIDGLEARATILTNCRTRAIVGSPSELAFDIDTLDEWRDAQARLHL